MLRITISKKSYNVEGIIGPKDIVIKLIKTSRGHLAHVLRKTFVVVVYDLSFLNNDIKEQFYESVASDR